MRKNQVRRPFIAGGLCAILWPVLSELLFYMLYPILAGDPIHYRTEGATAMLVRMADLGQRHAVVALEWSKVAFQFLLWPFLGAIYRYLAERGQRNLALIAVGMGFASMLLGMLSNSFNPTLTHSMGQAYVDAGGETEKTAILTRTLALLSGLRFLNQIVSLLYQGCVGLISLALIRARTWQLWGWIGIFGSLLALIAKLTPGIAGVTNFAWTGLAYFIWPVALGIQLMRIKHV